MKKPDSSVIHIVDSPLGEQPHAERRSFLAIAGAVIVGGIVAAFPFIAGWGVFFHPLRRRNSGNGDGIRFVRVGPLELVPADGVPHQFALSADMTDAWTRRPAQRVGSVFLSRTDTPAGPLVNALSSVCPHLGCAVDYVAQDG